MNGLYDEFQDCGAQRLEQALVGAGHSLGGMPPWLAGGGNDPEQLRIQGAHAGRGAQNLLSDNVVAPTGSQRRDIQSLERTLISSGNLEKVIRGTDLGSSVVSGKEMAGKIEGLRGKIEVKAEQDNFFAITVKQSASWRAMSCRN